MSLESVLFFLLVLFFWGLSVVARWLQEQMAKKSTDGIEFEPIAWSSGPDIESVPGAETPGPPNERLQPRPIAFDLRKTVRQKKMVRQLGLHRPQTLRQGIILLTVLGPCRAIEPSHDTRPF